MPDSRTHTPTPSLRQRLVEAAEFYAARPSVNQSISVPRMREISARECSELARLLHSAIASHDGLVEALRFYADAKNWEEQPGYESRAYDDDGDIARRALEAAGIKTTEGTDG